MDTSKTPPPATGPATVLAGIIVLLTIIGACSQSGPPSPPPNILLIVADDLGYADIGPYGGDIETPWLDTLARNGIRFSHFYTSPICAPSRAMLLTGNDNHIAGIGVQNYRSDQFGYEGKLSDRVIPFSQVLQQAGYRTMIAGKWHLGSTPDSDPVNKGFDRSFVSILGASNHFNGTGLLMDDPNVYSENGKKASWPEGKFSTDLYTDKLLSFLQERRQDNQPFFAFAAYTAPHWPLQVADSYRRKYEGRYHDGYENLRYRRLESLKKAGIISANTALPALHPLVTPWDSLPESAKKKEARKMELYAGMVDNMDENIGRLLTYLMETGEYENTLIIFMSDNGAGDEDYYNDEYFGDYLRQRYDNSFENMGRPTSFISYGPQWAEASSAPFRYFKGYLTEGGITAPMIMAGPHVAHKGTIYHGTVTLMDLAPTFYEASGTDYPDTPGLYPLKGTSLIPMTTGLQKDVHPDDYVVAMEHNSRTMLRKGSWKITQNEYPMALDKFELYNLANDPGEQENLKFSNPEKYNELVAHWGHFYQVIHGRIPPGE